MPVSGFTEPALPVLVPEARAVVVIDEDDADEEEAAGPPPSPRIPFSSL